LTADGTDEYIQHVGCGDLFQDIYGSWWAVVLGVRTANGRYVLGRESFLTMVEWTEDGWPVVSPVKMDIPRDNGREQLASRDNIPVVPDAQTDFVYIGDPDLNRYHFSDDARAVTLVGNTADLLDPTGVVTFTGKRQRFHEGSATVLMHILSGKANIDAQADLALYKDEHR
jgi:hypothetical protein